MTLHNIPIKKNIVLFLCSFIFISVQAQDHKEKRSGEISLSFSSFGETASIYFNNIIGAPSYENNGFYSIGLNYSHPINEWLEFETGLQYSKYSLYMTPHIPPNLSFTAARFSENLAIINIPVAVKANFLHYFFANAGLLVDLDVSGANSFDEQSGLGGLLGLGAKYHIGKGISIFLNPYMKMHSLFPVRVDQNHQRLAETGIRMGLSFDFNSFK